MVGHRQVEQATLFTWRVWEGAPPWRCRPAATRHLEGKLIGVELLVGVLQPSRPYFPIVGEFVNQIVTTSNPDAALNFGLEEHMEHSERTERSISPGARISPCASSPSGSAAMAA